MTDEEILLEELKMARIAERERGLFSPYNHELDFMLAGHHLDGPVSRNDDSESRYTTRDKIGKRSSKELIRSGYIGLGKCEERKEDIAYIKLGTHEENIKNLQTLYDLGVGMVGAPYYGDHVDGEQCTRVLYDLTRNTLAHLFILRWEDLHNLRTYEELIKIHDEDNITCLAGGDPYEILGRKDFNRVKKVRKIKLKKHKELIEKNRQARHQRRLWKAKTRKLKRQQRLMERVRNGDIDREDIIESTDTKEYRPAGTTSGSVQWLLKRKDKYSSLKEDKLAYDVVVDYFQGKVESIRRGFTTLWCSLPSCEQ